jgi:two-component sensor histidine kinase
MSRSRVYETDMPASQDELSAPELSLRLHQQGRVAAFGCLAMRTPDLQGILDEASLAAAAGLNTKFAKVLEFLPGQECFLVRSGVGWEPGVVGHARVGGDLQSPAGYAFRTGEPVISNHLASDQRFRTPALLVQHGITSAINVLVQAGDKAPFGVLEVDSTHRDDFTTHDSHFLQALANALAVAVETQQRNEAREKMLADMQALLEVNHRLLQDKDLLMQEVHHRVRNSLQLVRTILAMQARGMANEDARVQIEKASGRIMAIAAVHQRLYDGGAINAADAGDYLRGLLTDMRDLVPEATGDRELHIDIDPFQLPADDLTALGLITGELVTNALKHGRGKIDVTVRRRIDGLEIAVADEGDGFPEGFDPAARKGLGMRVIAALSKLPKRDAIFVDRSVTHARLIVKTAFGGG